jgi:hypothetical protein
MYILFLFIHFQNFISFDTVNDNFCKALVANDRAGLQKLVDNYLENLNPKADQQANFEKIQNWIAGHDCVDSVESKSELLDSDPPVKQFIVIVKGSAQPVSIGISLQKTRWRFNRK